MNPVQDNSKAQKWSGLLRGFGILCSFGSAVFLAYGGLHAYQRHTEAAKWPAVVAQVTDCSIHGVHERQHGVWGVSDRARCTFQYEAGGLAYEQTLDAGSPVFHSDKQVVLVPPKVTLEKIRNWIYRHPKGSTQTIHYNPVDPHQISLAGADDPIQENTAEIQLKIAGALFGTGLIFLLFGFVIRKGAQVSAAKPAFS